VDELRYRRKLLGEQSWIENMNSLGSTSLLIPSAFLTGKVCFPLYSSVVQYLNSFLELEKRQLWKWAFCFVLVFFSQSLVVRRYSDSCLGHPEVMDPFGWAQTLLYA
jgi:hypothetical protein